MSIKFGSDGFRGVIGHDFTYENVARIALAATRWCERIREGTIALPIGYDCRFLSERMAQYAASVVRSHSDRVFPLVMQYPCPSPFLAFCTHQLQQPLGVQITASHNPYYYNGVKLKSIDGGSLEANSVLSIETLSNELDLDPSTYDVPEVGAPPLNDLLPEYKRAINAALGTDPEFGSKNARLAMEGAGNRLGPIGSFPVVVDYMHGAAARVYGAVLEEYVHFEDALRYSVDPLFDGGKPEPLQPFLAGLIQRVLDAEEGTIGLAFDGDGDRLAVIDEAGIYLQSHEIFALLLDFLARSGYPGKRVVTTVSFSSLLGRIAASYGLETIEVPVGFKNVSEEMVKGDVLIGGEESGGAAFGHYLPERDALLMALVLLRAKSEAGVTLHEMLRGIYARFGRTEFVHEDVQLDAERAAELRARLPALLEVQSVAGERVTACSDKDGVKLRTAEGWVLTRASGTEPLARFYAEASSREAAQRMVADIRSRLL